MSIPNRLRILFFPRSINDQVWWVGQCLERDIAVQATSLVDAHKELAEVLAVHVATARELDLEPFSGLPSAPARFEAAYERAARVDILKELGIVVTPRLDGPWLDSEHWDTRLQVAP